MSREIKIPIKFIDTAVSLAMEDLTAMPEDQREQAIAASIKYAIDLLESGAWDSLGRTLTVLACGIAACEFASKRPT